MGFNTDLTPDAIGIGCNNIVEAIKSSVVELANQKTVTMSLKEYEYMKSEIEGLRSDNKALRGFCKALKISPSSAKCIVKDSVVTEYTPNECGNGHIYRIRFNTDYGDISKERV